MARTQTSRRYRQHGLTLVELLVVLSITSLSVLISASMVNTHLPRLRINQTAEQLVTDLKRARLHAEEIGEGVHVTRSEDGYRINKLDLHRTVYNDLDIVWAGNSIDGIFFTKRFANPGGQIEISNKEVRAIVMIHAITGKIERIE